ncbi:hypothetical protein IC235_04320 [Hymenobacter sp. BT664]|uniref:Uncharacterized protein n=1 Tax=Hymenobacter montanus TaxID=2771359 RepID=A0A927BAF0_9BACT|nr:hypothetical protein [Hymenobacter montanus]MBD2767120.1 hypothetical protein [Hymenobacter montanus]
MFNFIAIALFQIASFTSNTQPSSVATNIGTSGWDHDVAAIGTSGWDHDVAAIGTSGWDHDVAAIGTSGWDHDVA